MKRERHGRRRRRRRRDFLFSSCLWHNPHSPHTATTRSSLFTLFQVIDVLLLILSRGFFKQQIEVIHGTSKPKLVKTLLFRCLAGLLLVVDWIVLAATRYPVTRLMIRYESVERLIPTRLPWSAFLRGAMLIFRHEHIKETSLSFFTTVLQVGGGGKPQPLLSSLTFALTLTKPVT